MVTKKTEKTKKTWPDVAIEIISLLKTIFKSETVTPVGRMNFFLAFITAIAFWMILGLKLIDDNFLLYLLAFCILFICSVIMGSSSLVVNSQRKMEQKH